MSILIYAEHNNKSLKADTAKTVTAALAMGDSVHVLVAGHQCQEVAEAAAKISGVDCVLVADNEIYEHQLAESVSKLVTALAPNYRAILAVASTTGKNFMPRVAAMLDVAQISDVVEVSSADTFYRPIYAGNAIAKVKSLDAKQVLTIRASAFDLAGSEGNAEIKVLANISENTQSYHVKDELTVSTRPDLGLASTIISGGRGMQNGENFALLEGIADKLGAAIGASRAAVDAGFVPNDMQVGQTGKIVAPDLYIAVGISGAIQHLAGMKDSKVIVAINNDADAPIFQVADYGLQADLFNALPELESKLPA